MKLVNILILLSFIPSALSAHHEEHSSDDAHDMLRQESMEDISPDMADEVVSLVSNETDVGEDMLTQITSEVVNMTVTSAGEEAVADIANSILDAIVAVEESATSITGSANDLVAQVINEVLGTDSPTLAPTIFVPEETNVDKVIGKVTDTVNAVAETSGNVLNKILNPSPTPGP